MSSQQLGFGLAFEDLYRRAGLAAIDGRFGDHLKASDADLHDRLTAAREAPDALPRKDESELLIALGPHLEDFLAELFGIREPLGTLAETHHALAPLYTCKRLFVQRRAAKRVKPEQAAMLDGPALSAALSSRIGAPLTELGFAAAVMRWLDDEDGNADALAEALDYAGWALHTPAGRDRHGAGILFQVPHKTDPLHLVETETESVDGVSRVTVSESRRRRREGFALTDAGTDLTGALDEANYCIWCHNQGKDSCARACATARPAISRRARSASPCRAARWKRRSASSIP